MRYFIPPALILLAFVSLRAPAVSSIPTPEELLAGFRIDNGLRLELVAAEPQIESPVAMAFDERGRLWVVEMNDYPNGPSPGEKPAGRIKLLEDKDGDGLFESSTVFAEELLFANGLLPWRGGVFVTAAPHIIYLKDTNGDGQADLREVLFEGFAAQNPQLRVSHPILGPEGWVYVVNGLRGGKVRRAGNPKAEPVDISGRDFRFDPRNPDRHEAMSGVGQYGQTFDDWGNRFVCDNNHHLRHVVLEDRYLKRNPFLAVASTVQDTCELEPGPLSSGVKLYPLSKNWTTSSLHAGRFTAACSVFIYREPLLGAAYHGSAFTCDPTANVVHQEVLMPAGSTFRSRPARNGVEFLAHPSDWFRPVFLTSGPDGAIYVVDMCRAVIEHPEFMPEELKSRPDLLLGRDHGRIWRIVPASHPRRQPVGGLSKTDAKELGDLLAHPGAWHRITAQRLLLENLDQAGMSSLRSIASSSRSPEARLAAALLLARYESGLDEDLWTLTLEDPHPRVRQGALRVLDKRTLQSSPRVRKRVVKLAADEDAAVRFQAALALGDWDDDRILVPLAKCGCEIPGDRWFQWAVASSVPTRGGKLIEECLRNHATSPGAGALIEELALLVGARQEPAEVVGTITAFLDLPERHDRLRETGFNALAQGLARRGSNLHGYLQSRADFDDQLQRKFHAYLNAAAARAADDHVEEQRRIQAIRLLAHAPWSVAARPLSALVRGDGSPQLRLAAVRSLASHSATDVPELLMQGWPTYTPALRQEVVEAMLRDQGRVFVLLREVEAGRVKAGDIGAAQTRRLLNDSRPQVRSRADSLLKDALPAERKAVLEQYRAALTLTGNARTGQEVFRKHCAGCHRVNGIGVDVGADIADTRTKSLEGLLADILNPNQAIDGNYINYTVLLKNGQVVTGVIASETASAIVLKRAENQTDTLLRQDIEAIKSSGQSLMPEGLEKGIGIAEMADLLAFLKNWRYLDGSVPLAPSPTR